MPPRGDIEITADLAYVQPVEKLIPTEDRTRSVEPKGIIEPEDLHIFLNERILREVVDWSKSDLSREVGGVFAGDLFSWKGRSYLEIAGFIKARHSRGTSASFCFTHDAWSYITREREVRYADRLVVGWHHTHPGYGVFLSGQDLFSHSHFFNLPWMFALVVDPRSESLGFFQWKRRKVVPCGFFFVR